MSIELQLLLVLFSVYGNEKIDWNYKTDPEAASCLAMNDRRCSWHRGKAIGGTSAINGMIYIRVSANQITSGGFDIFEK